VRPAGAKAIRAYDGPDGGVSLTGSILAGVSRGMNETAAKSLVRSVTGHGN